MAEVGSAFVSILPSMKGFGSKLDSEVGSQVDNSGKKAGGRFGTALKAGALAALAGAAIATKFLGDAVGAASDLAENQSKVGVVFGKSAGQIMAASRTSATAMGLSKNAYLDATGTLGNLLVSLDIAPDKAAGMSQKMVKLAGDLASFNNVSPEEALDALKSGLTGETEPLKRFGVNMNDATLKAQALKMGLIKSTKEALTPQNKALAAQALIMAQTKTAQGDFARTSGGLANQQRILAAQTEDLKAKIGDRLLPIITKIVTKVNDFVTGMEDGTGAGGKFADILGNVGDVLGTVFGFISDNKAAVGTFAAGVLIAVGVVKTWAAAQWLLNAALTANPIGLVVVAIAALAAGIIYAYKHSETFRKIADAAFHGIATAASWMWNNVLKPVFKFFNTAISTVLRGLASMFRALGHVPGFGWATVLANKLDGAANKADGASRALDGLGKKHPRPSIEVVGADRAMTSLNTIRKLIHDIQSAGPVKKPVTSLGGLLGGHRATGGPVTGGKTYLVGERGPEIFTARQSGRIIPNNKIGAATGRGGNTFNIYETTSAHATARNVARIEAFAGGA